MLKQNYFEESQTRAAAIGYHSKTDFGTNRKVMYDFLFVINTNLPPILHRF